MDRSLEIQKDEKNINFNYLKEIKILPTQFNATKLMLNSWEPQMLDDLYTFKQLEIL